jgi:hypothetical protein
MKQRRPPLKARPEPKTIAEIREEIEFWEQQINGSSLNGAVRNRITHLRERLRQMTDLRNPDKE